MSLVAIEGGMCAGKTTISDSLGVRFGLLRLPEYFEMVSEEERAALESMTPIQRFEFFLGIDRKRSRLIKMTDGVQVADRCVFSMLATEFALWRLGIIADIDHALSRLEDSVASWPCRIVFLDVSDAEREMRYRRRPHAGYAHLFLRPDFNRYFKHFFELLPFPGIVFYVRNEARDISSTVEEVKDLATTPSVKRVDQGTECSRLRSILCQSGP
jgi:thymidylate kinase